MCESFASAFRRVAVNSSRLIIALSARCGDVFMYSAIRDVISEKYPSVRHEIFALEIRRRCRVKLSGLTSIRVFSSIGMMCFIFFRVFCLESAESDQSKLCQSFEKNFCFFLAHNPPGSFLEDPLSAEDELGREGGHGGDIYVCAVFIIKNPLVNNDREGQRVTFFCRSFFSSFSAGLISEITLNSKSEC